MNPLKQLGACGQSPWLDYVRRGLIRNGELETLIARDGVTGVTSNPSIFQKAIGESDEYLSDYPAARRAGDGSPLAVYEYLAVGDIQEAADVLRPVYDATAGRDGHVSLECSPYLAHDTNATIAEARRLWTLVNRPNLLVKVPGTPAGVPAIRTLIGEGISINVTLLFGIAAYERVADAYIAGLEAQAARGGDIARIASVASFFVSRIDALVDKRIDVQLARDGDRAGLEALRGKLAIANAKLAYVRFKEIISGARWEALAAKGAQPQRLLWASTSTKNPSYPDTLYVETLIGRNTVNTMPPATMDAFRDHGRVEPDTVERGVEDARRTLAALEQHGISLRGVTDELVEDGVKQFADAFGTLLGSIDARSGSLKAAS